jgi:hypothetical protein
MKGTLHKTQLYQGWVIRWSSPLEYKQPIHEYPLHPDDVQQILQDSQIFDNIEARIAAYPNVEFKLEKKYLANETITYAKLIPNKTEPLKNLNPDQWILIKKETIDKLIQEAKQEDIDTQIFEAIYEWLKKNNTLNK